jgi:hypothetical protein
MRIASVSLLHLTHSTGDRHRLASSEGRDAGLEMYRRRSIAGWKHPRRSTLSGWRTLKKGESGFVGVSTTSAGIVMWSGVLRTLVFGFLVGALVFALVLRLAVEVGQITGLDVEDRPGMVGTFLTPRVSSEAASANVTPQTPRRPVGQRRQPHG